ncbi:MAG: ParB/RepB/Spo0J family partition protein [Vicinamibacterales bacterium]
MTVDKRPALGRGLSALIPDVPAAPPKDSTVEIDIDLLTANPKQPRVSFDDAKLEELANSIRSNGVIQPLLVRRRGREFEIVAGERRWRAAQRAGLLKVPVVVRDIPDEKLLEVALIENIQRENLNPIDEALAYRKLVDELELTQDEVAMAVGKDRASVANYLRLLKLPDSVRALVATEALSMGHARALLGLERAERIEKAAQTVVGRDLSVRETEALVRRLLQPPSAEGEPPKDVHVRQAEERLRVSLGTRVRIVGKGRGGRIEIEYVSPDELQRLYERLTERS